MRTFIILPAAGLGTRMAHGGAAKQFLSVGGVPVLVRSLRIFTGMAGVAGITVAVREAETQRVRSMITEQMPEHTGAIAIVAGGETRQQSVARALASISSAADDDIIVVHDAVRPLVASALVAKVIESAARSGAAIVGTPAMDTIKMVERTADGALITSTIPRERVVLAQTPQAFRASLLRRAVAEADADGFTGTDEASLAERAGIPVVVVPGPARNFKITQPGDIELAEFYLSPGT